MAEEWTRFNLKLLDHPKVIAIAKSINRTPLNWKTYWDDRFKGELPIGLAVCVTMSGLMRTWCHVNAHAKLSGDDAILNFCDLDTIDLLGRITGLGEGMAHVGWAIMETKTSVKFPGFLTYNIPPEQRRRLKDAERKRIERGSGDADKVRTKCGHTAESCSVVYCTKEGGVGETTAEKFAEQIVKAMGMAVGPSSQFRSIVNMVRKAARLRLPERRKCDLSRELYQLAKEIGCSSGLKSPPAAWMRQAKDCITAFAAEETES